MSNRPMTVSDAVKRVMKSGQWMTLENISAQASELVGRDLTVNNIGARLRELRAYGLSIERRQQSRRHEYRLNKKRKP